MATFASLLSSSLHPLLFNRSNYSQTLISSSFSSLSFPYFPISSKNPRKTTPSPILASSDSSSNFNDFFSNPTCGYSDKKSVLSDLIQEIEPLDVSLIQRDVSPTTMDAMKRTISGMLGLLPSDRFKVFIEALWEPLSKLLVSSMMTGYTLRNAEYRLCLERSLDDHEGDMERRISQNPKLDSQGEELDSERKTQGPNAKNERSTQDPSDDIGMEGLGEISPEAQQYILHLQSRLSFVKKELHEVKRKRDALQMQQFVGEEKNDLLDYLRSLQPEKVAELSEPTCPELKEVIHSTVHGLLATLSPKIHSKAPSQSENSTSTTLNVGSEDCAELVENTSLNFQPLISLTRDYLARLLFWCMLLGHYLRGLENRMELTELLSLTRNLENDDHVDE